MGGKSSDEQMCSQKVAQVQRLSSFSPRRSSPSCHMTTVTAGPWKPGAASQQLLCHRPTARNEMAAEVGLEAFVTVSLSQQSSSPPRPHPPTIRIIYSVGGSSPEAGMKPFCDWPRTSPSTPAWTVKMMKMASRMEKRDVRAEPRRWRCSPVPCQLLPTQTSTPV